MTAAVTLLGGGPGDPGLLTLRAESVLASAAVVVVDGDLVALAAAFAPRARLAVLDRTDGPDRPDGAAGTAGTAGTNGTAGTDGTDELLRALAAGDGPVVRLYRGDPWLHPAHAAESAALRRAGVAVEAVPGVAVEVAVPAQAGIPLHTRPMAVTVTFATAEEAPTPIRPTHTLVISTGNLRVAAGRLADGADATMAAAALSDGGARRGTVGTLALDAPSEPGLLVYGAVCAVAALGAEAATATGTVDAARAATATVDAARAAADATTAGAAEAGARRGR